LKIKAEKAFGSSKELLKAFLIGEMIIKIGCFGAIEIAFIWICLPSSAHPLNLNCGSDFDPVAVISVARLLPA
jgi:hypothetical protein